MSMVPDAQVPGCYLVVGGCTMTAVSPDVVYAANDLLSRLARTVEPLTIFRKRTSVLPC